MGDWGEGRSEPWLGTRTSGALEVTVKTLESETEYHWSRGATRSDFCVGRITPAAVVDETRGVRADVVRPIRKIRR